MTITQQEYADRRRKLLKQLTKNSLAILPAALIRERNHDNDYPYRQHSDFYYLTGFTEPEAVIVLIPERPEGEFILFNQIKDPTVEVWTGKRVGQEGACRDFGANQAYAISELDSMLPELMKGRDCLYYSFGYRPDFDRKVINWFDAIRKQVRQGIGAPKQVCDFNALIHEMRLRKSLAELAAMRRGAEIAAQAIIRAMKVTQPGMYEYEIEAELWHHYLKNGGQDGAYPPIVGSGANSCVLHYTNNNAQMRDGDLLLIDAGVEYQSYASDITRTFPVNGRFTAEQRAIYEIVLTAQLSTIAMIKPGLPWNELQLNSDRIITEGLVALGLLSGDPQELMATGAHRQFSLHKIGHWLGLDTHDVGTYCNGSHWRKLETNFVLTVEPGIYIPSGTSNVDERWWNIGIRIEDDILVTNTGYEVLTSMAPKKIDAIEAIFNY